MSTTVHYHADFVAQGGPGFSGPTIEPQDILDETVGALAILYSYDHRAWVVADSQGNVYVQADTPAGLMDWMNEYVEAIAENMADNMEFDNSF